MQKENINYVNTYFRIEAGYEWGKGMPEEDSRRFYDEIILAFAHKGWSITPSGYGNAIYVNKGKTRLYVHPMELTGPCAETLVPKVQEILEGCSTCMLYRTDFYETLYDLSGDRLEEEYAKHNDEADEDILKLFTRHDKQSSVRISYELFRLGDKYHIPTIENPSGIRCSGDPADVYLHSRFNELCTRGLIKVTAPDFARTSNNTAC